MNWRCCYHDLQQPTWGPLHRAGVGPRWPGGQFRCRSGEEGGKSSYTSRWWGDVVLGHPVPLTLRRLRVVVWTIWYSNSNNSQHRCCRCRHAACFCAAADCHKIVLNLIFTAHKWPQFTRSISTSNTTSESSSATHISEGCRGSRV